MFDLSEEQRETLDAADHYARNELYPLASRMDNEEWWPTELFAKLGAGGYLGVTVPVEYGGAGMDLFNSGLVLHSFARAKQGMALDVGPHYNLCVNNLYRNADEPLRREYLPGVCSGQLVRALGLTDLGAGSDAL